MTLRRIKLKVGIVEVEVEGEQSDLDRVAMDLLASSGGLPFVSTQIGFDKDSLNQNQSDHNNGRGIAVSEASRLSSRRLTMANFANFKGCRTGKQLALAACEYIHFVKLKPVFDKQDIVTEMMKAKAIYKKSFKSNIKAYYLKPFLKNGTLVEYNEGVYALTSEAIKNAEVYFSNPRLQGALA